jgi:hypothetical protein
MLFISVDEDNAPESKVAQFSAVQWARDWPETDIRRSSSEPD